MDKRSIDGRVEYLDVLRIIATIAVVLSHVMVLDFIFSIVEGVTILKVSFLEIPIITIVVVIILVIAK